MNLSDRFAYYLLGFLLGCGLVYVLLVRKREFKGWMPESRVKEEILSHAIGLAEESLASDTAILRTRIKRAEIDFGRSVVRDSICRNYFFVDGTEKFTISLCDTVVTYNGRAD